MRENQASKEKPLVAPESSKKHRRYCNVPTYSLEMYRLRRSARTRLEDATQGQDARMRRKDTTRRGRDATQ
eukprot:scaffold226675_cov65-Attheya_sp.AAC.1